MFLNPIEYLKWIISNLQAVHSSIKNGKDSGALNKYKIYEMVSRIRHL
jgi:hypothetical protein